MLGVVLMFAVTLIAFQTERPKNTDNMRLHIHGLKGQCPSCITVLRSAVQGEKQDFKSWLGLVFS